MNLQLQTLIALQVEKQTGQNNPAIVGREWFLEKMASVAFQDWEQNNMFEFNAMMAWLSWRPPAKICVSLQGIFTHLEVDQ